MGGAVYYTIYRTKKGIILARINFIQYKIADEFSFLYTGSRPIFDNTKKSNDDHTDSQKYYIW